jgi:predicted AlkP superfamily phosphohydrolase/phosphomutase
LWPETLLFYIDPTGGLPPSLWVSILTGLLAALGAAWLMVKAFGLRAWLFLRAHYRALGAAAAALLIVSLAAMRLFKDKEAPSGSGGRGVVVLALDGLDPDLLERFMAAGRLPNFSRLAGESGLHRLATSNPPQSPVAWSSFITATEPGRHGVFDFIKRDPATYALDLALADRQRLAVPWHGTPFWESPALARLGVTALRMPMAFPPPKVQGRMLAGMGVWDVRGTEGTYIYLSTAPPDLPEARGIILKLEGEENALRGQLPGPYRAGQPDNVREPFVLDASKKPAVLRLQDRTYELHEGRWSDWVRVEFRIGPLGLQKVRAVTRMLLRRSLLDVNLYVSPLNFDPEAPLYAISQPSGYAGELVKAVGLYHTRGMPFDTTASNDGVLADEDFLEHCRIVDDESERMLAFELGRFQQGMLFGYFESPDVVQHMFWRGLEAGGPGAAGSDAIARWYERMDALVGRVRSSLGARGTLVVISDHGFAPFHTSIHLNSVLRDAGFLVLRDKEESSGQFFAAVDWPRTRAYAVGFNSIYLNLQGRESKGAVARADAAAAVSRLARRLEQWSAPGGARPILRAFPAAEIYPATDRPNTPDLVVGYARGYRASWETALGAVPRATSEPNQGKWSGDHCIDPAQVPGIFLSTDPRLQAARLSEVGPAIERYLAGNP